MTNIYVGNLDFATTEDQLRTLFAAYGAVETVTIVTDRDTGQPRGLAFVEMTSDGEAPRCYSRAERFGSRRARVDCQ
jgi:cold-inducible RNA-binding protein